MPQLDERTATFEVVGVPTGELEIVRVIGDVEPVFDALVYLPGEVHTLTVTLRNGTPTAQTGTITSFIGLLPSGGIYSYISIPGIAFSLAPGAQQTYNTSFTLPAYPGRAKRGWLFVSVGSVEYKWPTDIWTALTTNWWVDVADYIHPPANWGADRLGMPVHYISYNESEQTVGLPPEEVISNPAVVGVYWAGHGNMKGVVTTRYAGINVEQVEQWMANRPPMVVSFTARWYTGCQGYWYAAFSKQPLVADPPTVPGTLGVGVCEDNRTQHQGIGVISNMREQLIADPTLTFYEAFLLARVEVGGLGPGDEVYYRGDQTVTLADLGL